MGLSLAERKAVTRELARRYAASSKSEKGRLLDELCGLTGWSRRHARRALTQPMPSPRRRKAPVVYDDAVVAPLRRIWAVLGGPCGKRLAQLMAEVVAALPVDGA